MNPKAVLLSILFCCVVGVFVAYDLGRRTQYKSSVIKLEALQAQVDKKYCAGEVTYPQLKKELLK